MNPHYSNEFIHTSLHVLLHEPVLNTFLQLFRGQLPDSSTLIEKQDIIKLKKCIFSAQRTKLPPIVTHNVLDDGKDPVLCSLRRVQLFNRREDRVKVS